MGAQKVLWYSKYSLHDRGANNEQTQFAGDKELLNVIKCRYDHEKVEEDLVTLRIIKQCVKCNISKGKLMCVGEKVAVTIPTSSDL